ncbi:alpha/beta fold hydrolase [Pendulispora brunnea]|uniref:Alpha/beta fold hydrolase n=1 Tax=Pendulispora brunnea TaxID=2905690 RepID=A0ABZ2JWP0_9BACT
MNPAVVRAPLLLLHGFAGGPFAWDRVISMLSSERRILRPALLGHGADALEAKGASFEDEVERIAAQVRNAGLHGVHVCGYSLGGRVALGLLARHGHLFARATLIGVNPGLATVREREERLAADERWIERLRRDGVEAFLDAWEEQPLFASQRGLAPEALAEQRSLRRQHSVAGLARAMEVLGLARMPNYWEDLPRMAIPVTLMVGADDAKFLALAHAMAPRLAAATTVVVPGAGHNVVLEKPSAVVQALE